MRISDWSSDVCSSDLVIRNEPFPRIFGTRTIIPDGSRYFGPYASVTMMRTMLDMIKSLYPLRTCNLNLTPENIAAGKFNICLEYQIGNCKGPCEGLQSLEDYGQHSGEIREILKGKTGDRKSAVEGKSETDSVGIGGRG